MTPEPWDLTIHAAARLLAEGRLGARQLAEALIARRRQVDGTVRAFLHCDDDALLRAADDADRRRRAGRARGPFDGIPVAVKDNLSVEGQPCTCASRILDGYVAPGDATAVARLRAAGFIPAGRTNMDEFAMGSSTETSRAGPTANPWDRTRVPGGSSGGSAAAVAAREALAALGTDTGGSVRQPASFCGVVGFKPTYGRISRWGLVAYASSLDQIGTLTRDVRDAAILLTLMGGPDERDPTTLPAPLRPVEPGLARASAAGLRVGLPTEYLEADGLSDEVRAAVEAAAGALRDRGAAVVRVSVPRVRYAVSAYYIIAAAEASTNLARFDGVRYGFRDPQDASAGMAELYRRTRGKGFGPEVKRRILLGTYALSRGFYEAYYRRAQQVRALIAEDFAEAFRGADVLLAPVAPRTAFRLGEITCPLELYLADVFTVAGSLAGLPGASVPWALSAAGLPIGVQVVGPFGEDAAVLHAAALLEGISGGTQYPAL